jgi:ABC-type uncharacterized transport system auxiliary subunit
MKRRTALLGLVALPGCAILANDRPAPTFFVLRDVAQPSGAPQRLQRVLLVAPTNASAFYDTQSIAFSRASDTRAYYQYSAWTERPGRRFNTLLLNRLEQRAGFDRVASSTSGVRGDLLLATSLIELYHDDQQPPGQVRAEVSAQLTNRTDRTLVARRTFREEFPVSENNAEGAVQAFNAAISRLLDALVAWVEREAADLRPT